MNESVRKPPMTTVSIHRLTVDDIDGARSAFAMMHAVFEEAPSELSDPYLAELLGDPSFWALTAVDDSGPVGCVTAHELAMTRHEAKELFVYDLAVHPDRQRRGIATLLVRALVDAAAADGIEVVFVAADDEDDHALRYYESLGGSPTKATIFDLGDGPTTSP